MRLADPLRTTTFLLTLRYMVLFFVSVTILMAIINWAIIGFVDRRADDSVITALRTFAFLYQQGGPQAVAPLMAARRAAEESGDALYVLADSNYQLLTGNLPAWPELQPVEDGWVQFIFQRDDGVNTVARGRVLALGGRAWLLVGREVRDLGGLDRVLDRAFVLVLGSTLLLAMAGGLLMSANVLRRVNAINSTSKQIMAGDLSRRMPTRGTRDEFDELSLNLNAMLDQIETLLGSIRHISDNIAHDLRTPLTRLRNRLETVRRHARLEDTAEIDHCLEDADQLLSTFASLLSIARIESGASDASLADMDLGEVACDAAELYQALAEEKCITLECGAAPGLKIRGDRNLVFQAITNLLDNAIKYTKTGGTVSIAVSGSDERISLTVADNGPGIPANRREQVLQRFYRLDESRSAPGAGLGLSLVKAIAHRHKALLELKDNAPGLQVRLAFPRLAQA